VVAVKVVARDKLTEKLQQNLASEIHILKHMRHPNVVALYTFQKRSSTICLVLEYCGGGDLHRFIREQPNGRLREDIAQRFLRHLASGLQFLWEENLIHRDIKPQNILLTERSENAVLKIADFGFARYIGPTALAATLCGTPLYMAPEVLENSQYDTKADIWSVGCVYFEMLVGKPPFTGANHVELLKNIRTKRLQVPDDVSISNESVDVLRLLLNRSPANRGNSSQFLAHPILSSGGHRPDHAVQGHIEDSSKSFQEELGMKVGIPEQTFARHGEHLRSPSAKADAQRDPSRDHKTLPHDEQDKPTVSSHMELAEEPIAMQKGQAGNSPGSLSPRWGELKTSPRTELLPDVDISSPGTANPKVKDLAGDKTASQNSPTASQQTSSNSEDFVMIEPPGNTTDGDSQSSARTASRQVEHTTSTGQGSTQSPSGLSASSNTSVDCDVTRVANGLPFVEVYAQFAFAVATVADSRILRYLGELLDPVSLWQMHLGGPSFRGSPPGRGTNMGMHGAGLSAETGSGVIHMSPEHCVLLHEALTLYKKALAMLKTCVGRVRRHLSGFTSMAQKGLGSRSSMSEQQRAQGLLPWLLESMQNILERAEECNRRLKCSGVATSMAPVGKTSSGNSMNSSDDGDSIGFANETDANQAKRVAEPSPVHAKSLEKDPPLPEAPLESAGRDMAQSARFGRNAEEMMYEFASQLVQDGSAKELLGQVENAHAQLVRAQILFDALQLECDKGLSPTDAEQLRIYSQRLRQKIQALEYQNPSLPQSVSLIRRLVA